MRGNVRLKVSRRDLENALEIATKLEQTYERLLERLIDTIYTYKTWYTLGIKTYTCSQYEYICRNYVDVGNEYSIALDKKFITTEEHAEIELYFSTMSAHNIKLLLKTEEVYLDPYNFNELYKLL